MACPYCGSTNVSKEYYLGTQTGDYVCNDCKETFSRESQKNKAE